MSSQIWRQNSLVNPLINGSFSNRKDPCQKMLTTKKVIIRIIFLEQTISMYLSIWNKIFLFIYHNCSGWIIWKLLQKFLCRIRNDRKVFLELMKTKGPLAESFYYVNYGSSIIMSKVTQIISVMKTETLVFLLSSRQNMN